MTETEQLTAEVAELRTGLLNLAWQLDKMRTFFQHMPKGKSVNAQPNLEGVFRNLTALCYALAAIHENTRPIAGEQWCKALEQRAGHTLEDINKAFYQSKGGANV